MAQGNFRKARTCLLEAEGREFEVEILEVPFSENVEVRCWVDGELIRVSDRQLGEHEALRLLEEELINTVRRNNQHR